LAKKISKKARPTKKKPARARQAVTVARKSVPAKPGAKVTVTRPRIAPATEPRPAAPASPVPEAAEAQTANDFLSDAELRKCKSGLTKKDLEHYRELLLEKRGELLGDVESLQVDVRNNGGNLSNLPLHMADVGTDNYQQEFTLGLVQSEQKLLRDIHEALARIENGTYGVCIVSGRPIGKPRLDVKPWAKYCMETVRERERRGLPV